MTNGSLTSRLRPYLLRVRPEIRQLVALVARPVLNRLYGRIDARTAEAVRALAASQAVNLDVLHEQLEMARAAALAGGASSREVQRQLAAIEGRLVAIEADLPRARWSDRDPVVVEGGGGLQADG
jgi:hypothetical protein